MDALETYLREISDVRRSGAGVAETSYYPALVTLLSEAGRALKPRVRCVSQLANRGAGSPDIGLFTPDQYQRAGEPLPLAGQTPSRGVVEVKGTADDAWLTAEGEQVTRYWGEYGQVLVTNLRDFVLVGEDSQRAPAKLETYRLAENEADFWRQAATPRAFAQKQGLRFSEFLRRVLTNSAPLTAPKDLAWHLASYAREALARVEGADLEALGSVRTALEDALGLKFTDAKGEHFFRSTLVQTLFYGVFSAWVLWCKENPEQDGRTFTWRETPWSLHVPMIRALFDQVATPSRLGPLHLVEVLDWAEAALNRVDRTLFFQRFQETHAVQYFYEPFLEAFDPDLRKQLGVWYTPPEVVEYMVERVDAVLRSELDIPAGLADPRVYVLDPCAGTGSYLVQVLRRIEKTLRQRGDDALVGHDLKTAAMQRVYGFEILPAPFVVAHLQLGLLLQGLGTPFIDARDERAAVYLTNALTGWEPPSGPQARLLFPELEEERDAAEHVKREAPILVILGNPPYNGYAGVAVEEERSLSTAYRTARRTRKPQGQGLNDLYVRFFRMAERRIVEMTGSGIVCFISNYSWLDGLSFTAMRERYLEVFDDIWIDCLNGDKYKTGKLTPEGRPDPSIFSTEWNREGIQVGTAVSLLVRKEQHSATDHVRFRHLWGKTKRAELLHTATTADGHYEEVSPSRELGLPFVQGTAGASYASWPLLPDLLPCSYPGVKTSRDAFLIDIDRDRLVERLTRYFDPRVSDEEIRRAYPGVMANVAGFAARPTREYLCKRGFLPEKLIRYCYRPFDVRWLYWEPETKLLDRKREEYEAQVRDDNLWIEARQKQPMATFDRGYVTRHLADNFGNGLSSFFPMTTVQVDHDLFSVHGPAAPGANLSPAALDYSRLLGTSEALFYHCVATLRTTRYGHENVGALRQDWPRIPLPASGGRLSASAALGQRVAALLDTERGVAGVTEGRIRDELAVVGAIARVGGGEIDVGAGGLAVTAGWGHAGQGGVTMPARGRALERAYTPAELAAIEAGAGALGLTLHQALACLGDSTFDVYLNDVAYWRNIPARVWRYTLGGYQVIKKWLSYRERPLLGRSLMPAEAREVMNIARRIAALVLMEPALDANYEAVKQDTYPWPAG